MIYLCQHITYNCLIDSNPPPGETAFSPGRFFCCAKLYIDVYRCICYCIHKGGVILDTKKICKIGNSPAIRLNGTLLSAVSKLSEGDMVNVEYQKDKIIIKKAVE